jgi:hypothetical protein
MKVKEVHSELKSTKGAFTCLTNCPYCMSTEYRIPLDDKEVRVCANCEKRALKFSWETPSQIRKRRIENILWEDLID